jgi:hypothetical protein
VPSRRRAAAHSGQSAVLCGATTSSLTAVEAQAQAVLRAEPRDPNRLDADRDGIACENNPPPRDLVPVQR